MRKDVSVMSPCEEVSDGSCMVHQSAVLQECPILTLSKPCVKSFDHLTKPTQMPR